MINGTIDRYALDALRRVVEARVKERALLTRLEPVTE